MANSICTFRPSEVKGLVADYFEACLEKGITSVRVIHGKGTGTLRETVHALLKNRLELKASAWETSHQGAGSYTR